MKKKKNYLCYVVLLFVISLFGSTQQAFASEFSFGVVPNLPDNQIDKDKTYFDLLMEPGKEQNLILTLRNDTEKEVIVEIGINAATTNLNGVVEYGENKSKKDKTLIYNMKKLATCEKEVAIPAKGEKEVPINVKMPKDKIDGLIAGGITLQEKEKEEKVDSSSKKSGLAIENKYSYVLALLLRQNKNPIETELVMNDVGVSQVNYRNVIFANLQNPQPKYLNQMSIEGKVTKKGEKETLYTVSKDNMQMAPNSNFDVPIYLDGDKLVPGKYELSMVVYGMKSPDGKYSHGKNDEGQENKYNNQWEFTKEFTVKREEANKLNDLDVTVKKEKDNLLKQILTIVAIIVIIVTIVTMSVYVIKEKRKKKTN